MNDEDEITEVKGNQMECPYCGHIFEVLTIGHVKIGCPKCGAFLKEEKG